MSFTTFPPPAQLKHLKFSVEHSYTTGTIIQQQLDYTLILLSNIAPPLPTMQLVNMQITFLRLLCGDTA